MSSLAFAPPRVRNSYLTSISAALIAILVGAVPVHAFTPFGAPQGAARRWEASLPVGLYGQVNLRTGRVLTTIPITGWSGRGPSIQFNLYHNQNSAWGAPGFLQGDINGDEVIDENDIDPFIDLMLEEEHSDPDLKLADFNEDGDITIEDLASFFTELETQPTAPEWRHSYSAELEVDTSTQNVTLTRDDGTKDLFEYQSNGSYKSPFGVWEMLTRDTNGVDYTLTSKGQWKAHFNRIDGTSSPRRRLEWIADASRDASGSPTNKVKCEYVPFTVGGITSQKLVKVFDATGTSRYLEFYYSTNGRMVTIYRILGGNTLQWNLLYEVSADPAHPANSGTGPLLAVELPNVTTPISPKYRISFTYRVNPQNASQRTWDIDSITEQHAVDANQDPITPRTYWMNYYQGRLNQIFDPDPFGQQQQTIYYFEFSSFYEQQTQYVDRRGNPWKFTFDTTSGNLVELIDPLNHTQSVEYGDPPGYPLMHEVSVYTNALGQAWLYQHNLTNGDLEVILDPESSIWMYDYDALHNLVMITPPGELPGTSSTTQIIEIEYDDPLHPTSPTKIIEPGANPGDPVVETLLSYHALDAGNNPTAYGKLKKVIPPFSINPVVTEYTYDPYGRLNQEREGAPTEILLDVAAPPVVITTDYAPDGTPKFMGNGINSGETPLDNLGRPIRVDCADLVASEFCAGRYLPDCFPSPPNPGPAAGGGDCQFHFPSLPAYFCPVNSGCTNGNISYNPNGETTAYPKCAPDGITGAPTTRTHEMNYDNLGRLTSASITSIEATATSSVGTPFVRTIQYGHDWTSGYFSRTGPDGTLSEVQLDAAGRPVSYARRKGTTDIFTVQAQYDDGDRVTLVAYGNGTQTRYEYDLANRLTKIRHEWAGGALLHQLQYAWTPYGLVDYITETTSEGGPNVIDFTYDRRNRLVQEQRTGLHPYGFAYTYDKAGNRLTKQNLLDDVLTVYTYDVSDPEEYFSQGNRLVKEVTYFGDPVTSSKEQVYLYDLAGRMVRTGWKITGDANENGQWYHGVDLLYNSAGLIWIARSAKWQLNASGAVINEVGLSAMEYRYDSARGRYRTQRRDPRPKLANGSSNAAHFLFPYDPSLADGPCWNVPAEGTWSDYSGDGIHGDYTLAITGSPPNQTITKNDTIGHEPGLGQFTWTGTPAEPTDPNYANGNLIGTTEAMTDDTSSVSRRAVFTAFGEPVYENGSTDTRYGYAGAWGYQEAGTGDPLAELGWQHVGHRYYDPSSGRFVQRDPIGIRGGLNTYGYCHSLPTRSVDPSGLTTIGIGIDLDVIGPGFAGSAGIGLHIGHDSNSPWYRGWSGDVLVSGGAGVGGGAGAGASAVGTYTNADCVSQLTGKGWCGGIGAGPIYVGGVGGSGYAGAQGGVGLPGLSKGTGANLQHTYTIGVIDSVGQAHTAVANGVGYVIWKIFY
ncbi:MAG: hypothetical protein HZA51_01750 [Planctomycetes bacterium]|nr:hypothetical protein [Planctomycetota bacterium]